MAGSDESLCMAAEVVDKFSQPLRNMQRSLRGFSDEVAKSHKEGAAGAKEHLKHFDELRKSVKEASGQVRETLNPALAAFGIGTVSAAAGVAAIADAVRGFIGQSRDLSFISKEVGLTIQQLRVFDALAESVGSSTGAMNAGLHSFAKNMADVRARVQGSSIESWFAKQPLTRDLEARLRSTKDNATALSDIMETLGRIQGPNAQQQKELLLEAFGLPLELARKSGKEFLEEYEKINHRLKPLTEAQRKAGVAAAESFDALRQSMTSTSDQIGAAFGPAVVKLSEELGQFVEKNGPALKGFFDGVGKQLEGVDWTAYGAKVEGAYHLLETLSKFVVHDGDMKPLPWAQLIDEAGLSKEVENLREWMKSNSISDAMRDWLHSDSISGALTDGLKDEIEAVKKTWDDFGNWMKSNSISDSITGALKDAVKPPKGMNNAPGVPILPRPPTLRDQFKPLRPGFQPSAFHPDGDVVGGSSRGSTSEAIAVITAGTRAGTLAALFDFFQSMKGSEAGGGISAIQAAYRPSNDNTGGTGGAAGTGALGGLGRSGPPAFGGGTTGGADGHGGGYGGRQANVDPGDRSPESESAPAAGGKQAGGWRHRLGKFLGMDKGSARGPGSRISGGSSDVNDAIRATAGRAGMDEAHWKAIASIESSLTPSSNMNRGTQYKGLFQIGSRGAGSEWARKGSGNIYNAMDNAKAAADLAAENNAGFKRHFGRDPTSTETYMMHQQGLGFYTRGAMTNIAGNPYPGMRGPQTHQSFEAGWGREIERRAAMFADRGNGSDRPADTGNSGRNNGAADLPMVRGVDPRIQEIVNAAGKHLPKGYSLNMTSGYRGPNVPNHNGNAADYQIIGPDGKPLSNRGEDPTGLYQTLARHAQGEMLARHPDLKGRFAWGGAFGTQLGGGGPRDLMHFDINGERGRYSDYQLHNMGPVPGEKYGSKFQPPPIATNPTIDKDAITKSANELRERHNDIFGVRGRRNAKFGIRNVENEGGLLDAARQTGAFGTTKHSVEGNAAVHVSFSGLPAGARTKASADGMFKTIKLNRGNLPGVNDSQTA